MAKRRRPYKCRVYSLVVSCALQARRENRSKTSRRRYLVDLICGHQVVRVLFGPLYPNTRVQCKPCSVYETYRQRRLPEMEEVSC